MHGRTCKQYIFRSYNIYLQCYAFRWRSFHMPVWKGRRKVLWVSNFALLWVVFKWHHGSEGVNMYGRKTICHLIQTNVLLFQLNHINVVFEHSSYLLVFSGNRFRVHCTFLQLNTVLMYLSPVFVYSELHKLNKTSMYLSPQETYFLCILHFISWTQF